MNPEDSECTKEMQEMPPFFRIGKYILNERLGQGGYGIVYRAIDKTLDREVAIKVLNPIWTQDLKAVERFIHEAKIIARFRHPHIITVYEVEKEEFVYYIAMELARGQNLGQAIKAQGRISWAETLTLLHPICEALDYAHRHLVVHRDIKPSNILVDQERGPFLVDFGIARLTGGTSANLTPSGTLCGTPSYIAPEVWEARQPAGPAADIYSLGCVTYEMLTGEILFNGETPMQIMHAHYVGPQFPVVWPDDVPEKLVAVLCRSLAKNPQERYPNAMAFWRALSGDQRKAWRLCLEDKSFGEIKGEETIIGRATSKGKPDLDLSRYGIPAQQLEVVSTKHCRIYQTKGDFYIEDLGSKNGTWLNGIKLNPKHPHLLEHGDEFSLANRITLEFQVTELD